MLTSIPGESIYGQQTWFPSVKCRLEPISGCWACRSRAGLCPRRRCARLVELENVAYWLESVLCLSFLRQFRSSCAQGQSTVPSHMWSCVIHLSSPQCIIPVPQFLQFSSSDWSLQSTWPSQRQSFGMQRVTSHWKPDGHTKTFFHARKSVPFSYCIFWINLYCLKPQRSTVVAKILQPQCWDCYISTIVCFAR